MQNCCADLIISCLTHGREREEVNPGPEFFVYFSSNISFMIDFAQPVKCFSSVFGYRKELC